MLTIIVNLLEICTSFESSAHNKVLQLLRVQDDSRTSEKVLERMTWEGQSSKILF